MGLSAIERRLAKMEAEMEQLRLKDVKVEVRLFNEGDPEIETWGKDDEAETKARRYPFPTKIAVVFCEPKPQLKETKEE